MVAKPGRLADQIAEAILAPVESSSDSVLVTGARIQGKLDLSSRRISKILKFDGCYFKKEEIVFKDADLRTVKFLTSSIRSLTCAVANFSGGLALQQCLVRDGVRAHFSHISGGMEVTGSVINSTSNSRIRTHQCRQ